MSARNSKQLNDLSRSEILPIKEASERLGKKFSISTIRRKIDSGEWEEGKHWVNCASPNSKIRSIKINVTYVLNSYAIPAHLR